MKVAKCVECKSRFEESNSSKMYRAIERHFDETGHRSFRGLVGYGNVTFRKPRG